MWQKLTNQFDRNSWNQFVKENGPMSGRFLQSWEWGEFQGAQKWVLGKKGVANVICKRISGIGEYAYCPRGPVVDGTEVFSEDFETLVYKIENVLFLRSDIPATAWKAKAFRYISKKTLDLQPSHTWITLLTTFHHGELLSTHLHSKTRYNIKLAERHGVKVSFDVAFDDVWPLFESTSKRSQFRLHHKSYYKKMLDTLHDGECRAFLATALYKDEPVAANIMIDFASVRTYLHGASSYAHRSLMAPHLLHWSLLQDALEKGMTHYDWWGIAPSGVSDHPWAGITRFKKSFPGQELIYPGTYDLVKKPLRYKLYQLARQLIRVTR